MTSPDAEAQEPMPGSPMREILDRARWAPSGDNTQPWRFEPISDARVRVHGFDTREHCVYDLDGRASRLSIGAMLETLRIAATGFGVRALVERDCDAPEDRPVFDVRLEPAPGATPDTLAPFIEARTVQRRPLSRRPLTEAEKQALAEAVGPDHELSWFERDMRWQFAKLLFRSAHIRLTIEEAWRVHASVIEWRATQSADRIPDAALGLDPLSLVAMRWVMGNWPRTRFVSRYLGGTLAPRLQLDLLPGLMCAAHVLITARSRGAANATSSPDVDADFAAGSAVQRFWLTAEKLGLQHQPEITPLVFARYAAEGRRFTTDAAALRNAQAVAAQLDELVGRERRERAVWVGRIGAGPAATARSLRLPLTSLMVRPDSGCLTDRPEPPLTRAASCSPW